MKGQVVVCISAQALDWRLNVGEHYTVCDVVNSKVNGSGDWYVVQSASGERYGWISDSNFKPLSEWREERLNELGL
jgi:hypothetical protein